MKTVKSKVMRKNPILLAMMLAVPFVPAVGQDIYQMEMLTSEDLNGTARFVGMGGAMSALGADISTMGSNPAGIGLYRRSDVAASFSIMNLADADKFDGNNPTYMSFDNLGFVYSVPYQRSSGVRFFNFGFNYHKRKDANQLLNVSQMLQGNLSQTLQMGDLAYAWGEDYVPFAQQGYETYLINPIGERDEQGYYPDWNYYNAYSNSYRKARSGSVQQFDFNFSCNIDERWYLGLTIGAYNVDVNSYSMYGETLDVLGGGNYALVSDRSLSGSGFDVKFGAIVRPIADSPFRIGLAVSTPTYYNLRNKFSSYIASHFGATATLPEENHRFETDGILDYDLRTPWKFNLSLGHTFGSFLALGAEYEYADYSTCKVSYGDYDWFYGSVSTDDHALRNEARRHLKGVSTIRVGAEANIGEGLFLRAGYNYVSSPFEKNAYLNLFNDSPSVTYAPESSYLNLSETNRYTCGIGYRDSHFYADLAYQYTQRNATFYAFNTQREYVDEANVAPGTKIDLNKHQVLLTLGYKF